LYDARQAKKARDMALQVIGMAKAMGIDPFDLSRQIVRVSSNQDEQP
jgi:hypothetical protein